MTLRLRATALVSVAAASMTLAACQAGDSEADAAIEARLTALEDKQAIEDLVTGYYNSLGHSSPEHYVEFYSEDAEMVMGGTVHSGREAIADIYRGLGDTPQRRAAALNIAIDNLVIELDGDSARGRLFYTEYLAENEGETPQLFVQGREFDHFTKVDGKWYFQRRELLGGRDMPEGWED